MNVIAMWSVVILTTSAVLTVTAQENLMLNGTARQSSTQRSDWGAGRAIDPPVSNDFLSGCTHTKARRNIKTAWWMFTFSFGLAYVTDITIYYRQDTAIRMDGFALYVTNVSATVAPPDGYLCFADTKPGFPNVTMTIPCYQMGKYVIYYDTTGNSQPLNKRGDTITYGPIIELCYVEINGELIL
ncbi:uncharacterized protein LOC127738204 [Mytilus californianus]|uniref:uncharacterized protein LOC127738204 n=1 Tax=Mytilus californianus TaxID=6549 RepID=UPI0022469BA8|nr:uncharacterized protein LOC127738204 [Mytilus californianus]